MIGVVGSTTMGRTTPGKDEAAPVSRPVGAPTLPLYSARNVKGHDPTHAVRKEQRAFSPSDDGKVGQRPPIWDVISFAAFQRA
jgi:hypothetical protein